MIIELNLLTYGMEAAAQKGATGWRSEPGVNGEVIRGLTRLFTVAISIAS